jgi:pimeloyl-ACP methyl ester carboxylesterase
MRFRLLVAACWLLACADEGGDPELREDAAVDATVPAMIDGGPEGGIDGGLPDANDGALNWRPCGERDGGYECVTLNVPVPMGTRGIALARLPASGSRLGSLVWNPGGPGASAIESLPTLAELLGRAGALAHYDLVAMDPRGVGLSDPILCHSKLKQLYAVDATPDDEQEWAAIDAVAKQFADECASKYSIERLSEMRTLNIVDDLDLLRQRLGEEKLNFLGFSYGAGLGSRYAARYPDRVGRLVLDGPPDLALDTFELSLQQAKGFEQALANYFAWCTPTRCRWADGDYAEKFAALQQQVEAAPFPSPRADRPCGPGEFVQGVIAFLYGGEEGWEYISDDLYLASMGDGSGLVDSTDIYLGRYENGGYSNITEANYAVNCADDAPLTLAQIRAHEAEFRAAAPTFGVPILTHVVVCAHWAVQGAKTPAPANVNSSPILVLGTTQDPATPYAWAQATATRLGPAARLFSYDGEGHTAYARKIPCVDATVDDYLISGTLPAVGQSCADSAALVHGGAMLSRRPAILRR